MATPSITPDSFVPSRLLKHQLFAVGIAAAITIAVFIAWPPLTSWLLTTTFLPPRVLLFGES